MNAVVLHRGLEELSLSLIDLHRSLLHVEQRRHEQSHGVIAAAQLLNLVVSDPQFAWLHDLSGLIVEVDERLSQDHPIALNEAAAFRARTEARISSERLRTAVQESPEVAIGLGRLRLALAQLPVKNQVLA